MGSMRGGLRTASNEKQKESYGDLRGIICTSNSALQGGEETERTTTKKKRQQQAVAFAG